jgi:hypothetical protein
LANIKAELLLIGCSLIIKDDFSPHGWKICENKIIGRPMTIDLAGVSGKGKRYNTRWRQN